MTLRSATRWLLALALGLPVVQAVLLWIRALLASMEDPSGAAIVGHIVTACQVVWSLSLVGLIIVLALIVLNERPEEQ